MLPTEDDFERIRNPWAALGCTCSLAASSTEIRGMSARQGGHDIGCTSESGSHLDAVWGTSAGLRSGLGKSQSSRPMIIDCRV